MALKGQVGAEIVIEWRRVARKGAGKKPRARGHQKKKGTNRGEEECSRRWCS